jgi:2-hydroxychromene-2-carboxylate isomerase
VKCGRAATTIKSFRERFRTQIQFAYRHFPRVNQNHLELQYIYGYAEDLGLAMARFTAEMDDEVHLPAVRAHLENGLATGVQSAPAFLVDGQIVDTSYGLGSLFEATEDAIRRWRDMPVLPLG